MVRAAIAGVAFLRTFRIDNSLLKRTVQRSDRTLIQPRTRDSSVLVRDVAKQLAETHLMVKHPLFLVQYVCISLGATLSF